jgi:putative hydrolase of the HAD superfamily
LKLYIFDVGGVMVDGFDVSAAIAQHLGIDRAKLLPLIEESGFVQLHSGLISSEQFWQQFSAHTGIAVDEELWGKFFAPQRRPGMYSLVRELQQAGHRVVGGTNTLDSHYAIHSAAGDYDVFDVTYASNLMKHSKPDAEFYLHILAAEGVKPEEAVFIDDMPVNVEAAAALGLSAILFTNEAELRAALSVHGTLPV